jgi:hypothetical protein
MYLHHKNFKKEKKKQCITKKPSQLPFLKERHRERERERERDVCDFKCEHPRSHCLPWTSSRS